MSFASTPSAAAPQHAPTGRAGAVVLVGLRLVLLAMAGSLVFAIGNVAWQAIAG